MQYGESKQIYQDVVDGKLNIGMVILQLRNQCLAEDAIHLIVACAIVRHDVSTGTHDLNKFHQLIDRSNLHGIRFPDFTICKKKIPYNKLNSSIMHILPLGLKILFHLDVFILAFHKNTQESVNILLIYFLTFPS